MLISLHIKSSNIDTIKYYDTRTDLKKISICECETSHSWEKDGDLKYLHIRHSWEKDEDLKYLYIRHVLGEFKPMLKFEGRLHYLLLVTFKNEEEALNGLLEASKNHIVRIR